MRYIGKQKDVHIETFYFVDVFKDDDKFDDKLKRILDLNVKEIAKKSVQTIAWNAEIEDIAAILGKKRIKKLQVERNGVLVGIISRGDVIRHSFKSFLVKSISRRNECLETFLVSGPHGEIEFKAPKYCYLGSFSLPYFLVTHAKIKILL